MDLQPPITSTQPHRYPVVPGILFLLLLLALLILPEAARRLVIQQLEASLEVPVSIRDVDLNLITGRARISGLVIGSKNGAPPILDLPRLDLHFKQRLLLEKQIIIERVIATGARVNLERTGLVEYKGIEILRPVESEWGVVGNFKLDIQEFEARSSQITVTDRRTTPVLITTVGNIEFNARPSIKTGVPTKIDLKLAGTLPGSSSMKLKGWFTPFAQPLQVQLEGSLEHYELSYLNPYAKTYLGNEFRRGRISSDFKFRINGDNIDAFNDLRIRQVEIGANYGDQFKRQVGVSLKTAVSLLEDSDGGIHLPISVKGKINSPEFDAGDVMWKALRNGVVKTMIAPFRLLGNIITLGGKITEIRIDPVHFRSGSLTLDKKAQQQIERLSTFLKSRPTLDLQLQGRSSRTEANVLARRKPGGKGVTDRDLRALAERRVRLIEKTMARQGVPSKRLFVLASDRQSVMAKGTGRVEFRVIK